MEEWLDKVCKWAIYLLLAVCFGWMFLSSFTTESPFGYLMGPAIITGFTGLVLLVLFAVHRLTGSNPKPTLLAFMVCFALNMLALGYGVEGAITLACLLGFFTSSALLTLIEGCKGVKGVLRGLQIPLGFLAVQLMVSALGVTCERLMYAFTVVPCVFNEQLTTLACSSVQGLFTACLVCFVVNLAASLAGAFTGAVLVNEWSLLRGKGKGIFTLLLVVVTPVLIGAVGSGGTPLTQMVPSVREWELVLSIREWPWHLGVMGPIRSESFLFNSTRTGQKAVFAVHNFRNPVHAQMGHFYELTDWKNYYYLKPILETENLSIYLLGLDYVATWTSKSYAFFVIGPKSFVEKVTGVKTLEEVEKPYVGLSVNRTLSGLYANFTRLKEVEGRRLSVELEKDGLLIFRRADFPSIYFTLENKREGLFIEVGSVVRVREELLNKLIENYIDYMESKGVLIEKKA